MRPAIADRGCGVLAALAQSPIAVDDRRSAASVLIRNAHHPYDGCAWRARRRRSPDYRRPHRGHRQQHRRRHRAQRSSTPQAAPVTPGLFGGVGHLGVEEIGLEPSEGDYALALGEMRPEFDVTLAFNPDSTAIGVNRIGGVTFAVLAPDARRPARTIGPGARSSPARARS